jgi:AcrR family transcriptional regulator
MATTDLGNRHDRRRVRTRTQLTDAARALIAEKGVAGLRVGDVTDVADVGRGSFYNYFESKEALVEAVVLEQIATTFTALIDAVRDLDDAEESASAAHRWFVRRAYEEPQLAWLVVHLYRADAVILTTVLEYGRPMLERFCTQDPDLALTHTVGATVAMTRSILEGRIGPDADIPSAEILLQTLGVEPERARAIARRPLPEVRRPAGMASRSPGSSATPAG